MSRICFFINDLRAGGAEKNLAFIVNGLSKRGHAVAVACYSYSGDTAFFRFDDAVHVCMLKHTSAALKQIKDRHDKEAFLNKQLREVRDAITEIKPDIAVSFLTNMNILLATAAKQLGVKCVVCERNDPSRGLNSAAGIKKRNEAFRISTGCIFQTKEVQAYFGLENDARCSIIPNPVILTAAPIDDSAERRRTIVSVGRYDRQKNHGMLLEGFSLFHSRHPDFILEIYGRDYGEKDGLQRMAARLGISSCAFFYAERTDVHEQIRDAFAFALTSDYEGLPNALAEAVALGIPSISTDCASGGPADILRNGERGLLIPAGDAFALYTALESLAEDNDLARALAYKGRQLSGERSPDRILDLWEQYLTKLKGDEA